MFRSAASTEKAPRNVSGIKRTHGPSHVRKPKLVSPGGKKGSGVARRLGMLPEHSWMKRPKKVNPPKIKKPRAPRKKRGA
jgi:hypothetical protein